MPARTITTRATGRGERAPDLATVEVNATGEGETATVARTAARDRAGAIRDSVETAAPERVRTVDFQVEASGEAFGPCTDAEYWARERLEIDCVPETAADVVVEATDAGGTVESVEFGLHDAVYSDLSDRALSDATDRARVKAERIAAAEDLVVDRVLDVTATETDSGRNSLLADAISAGPGTDIHPTPVEVVETVEVTYELEDG
jgi:uncharacterized protein YggE